jgi:small conductance mechanosensitive channel
LKTLTHLFLLALIASAFLIDNASAQNDVKDDARSIETLIESLEGEIKAVHLLRRQIDVAEASNREVLIYRQDERIIKLLADFAVLADKVTQLPEDSPERLAITAQMSEFGSDLGPYMFQRIDDVSQQIAELNAKIGELGGARLVTAQAHVFMLESILIQSQESLVSLVLNRDALDFSTTDLRDQLIPKLYLSAETLAGRVESSGATRNKVQDLQSVDPDNADINAAIKQLDSYHEFNIDHLNAVILLLDSLGLDSADYQAVMLQQSGSISVNFFSTTALLVVLEDSWGALKESIKDNSADLLFRFLVFIAILLVFRTLSRVTKRVVRAGCNRSSLDMSLLLKNILVSTSGGTVMALGILMALSQVGISLTPMLAGLGVAGFIVGFALQDSLGNFAAGAMILIYRPFDVGDLVEVPGAGGLVKKMNLVSTTITTLDNQTLVVPNSKIWGDVIKNVTAQTERRVDLEFGIAYDDDIELAERVLTEIVIGHEKVLTEPKPTIKLHTLGDSSVNFIARPWTKTEDYWDVYWDIMREVKLRFDREGISIPFPQRDVHVYSEPITEDS